MMSINLQYTEYVSILRPFIIRSPIDTKKSARKNSVSFNKVIPKSTPNITEIKSEVVVDVSGNPASLHQSYQEPKCGVGFFYRVRDFVKSIYIDFYINIVY